MRVVGAAAALLRQEFFFVFITTSCNGLTFVLVRTPIYSVWTNVFFVHFAFIRRRWGFIREMERERM